jgi:cytochrome P450
MFSSNSFSLAPNIASVCVTSSFANLNSSYNFGKGRALVASTKFYPPFDKLLRYVIPRKVLQKMLDHRTMSSEKVHKRLGSAEQRPDFINTIMTQNDGKGEQGMTLKEIELNMSILVFAGSETTASALSGILRMLLQSRQVMMRLKNEIRASYEAESDITIASVGRIKYLDAVINEGIRLCPPV